MYLGSRICILDPGYASMVQDMYLGFSHDKAHLAAVICQYYCQFNGDSFGVIY